MKIEASPIFLPLQANIDNLISENHRDDNKKIQHENHYFFNIDDKIESIIKDSLLAFHILLRISI